MPRRNNKFASTDPSIVAGLGVALTYLALRVSAQNRVFWWITNPTQRKKIQSSPRAPDESDATYACYLKKRKIQCGIVAQVDASRRGKKVLEISYERKQKNHAPQVEGGGNPAKWPWIYSRIRTSREGGRKDKKECDDDIIRDVML